MCEIDWSFVAEMLGGTGLFMTGLAALFMLPLQLGYWKQTKELKSSIKPMLPIYINYMKGEEGIVWSDYPDDADEIIEGIARMTDLEKKLIRELLDELRAEGKI